MAYILKREATDLSYWYYLEMAINQNQQITGV